MHWLIGIGWRICEHKSLCVEATVVRALEIMKVLSSGSILGGPKWAKVDKRFILVKTKEAIKVPGRSKGVHSPILRRFVPARRITILSRWRINALPFMLAWAHACFRLFRKNGFLNSATCSFTDNSESSSAVGPSWLAVAICELPYLCRPEIPSWRLEFFVANTMCPLSWRCIFWG